MISTRLPGKFLNFCARCHPSDPYALFDPSPYSAPFPYLGVVQHLLRFRLQGFQELHQPIHVLAVSTPGRSVGCSSSRVWGRPIPSTGESWERCKTPTSQEPKRGNQVFPMKPHFHKGCDPDPHESAPWQPPGDPRCEQRTTGGPPGKVGLNIIPAADI